MHLGGQFYLENTLLLISSVINMHGHSACSWIVMGVMKLFRVVGLHVQTGQHLLTLVMLEPECSGGRGYAIVTDAQLLTTLSPFY